MLPPKGGDPMTPEREFDLSREGDIASATEYTGMLPAITNESDPDALSVVTEVPCPVTPSLEDPAHSPLLGGSVRPYGAHSPRKTTPAAHPAKAPGPYHRDSGHNP